MGINGALELHDDWMVNSWMFYASTDFYRLLPTSTDFYLTTQRGTAAPRLPACPVASPNQGQESQEDECMQASTA